MPQAEVDRGPPQRSARFGAQGSRFSPSVAADLDSGPDSAPDPVTDEEGEEDERDLRLPGATVEELPGLSGRGRMGAEGPGAEQVPQAMRLQPRSLFTGAAEEEVWDSGSPLDTPLGTPPGTPAATGPCATELSPGAAPATGAGGAEPSQLPGEVRAGGTGWKSVRGSPLTPAVGVQFRCPYGLWCCWGGSANAALPSTPALSLKYHLCLPAQDSPRTGRRPKGEQDPARLG